MAVNSKQKGKRGEREFARLCREHGYDNARRGQQYSGVEGEDVIGLPGVHVEVKRHKTITPGNIKTFLTQSIRDAKQGELPILAHREDYGKWYISMEWQDATVMYCISQDIDIDIKPICEGLQVCTMPENDWFEIYREYEATLAIAS